MTELLAIAWTGFTEARRNRVTVLVGVFALVSVLMTSVVLEVAVFTLDRVATNFGLGMMSALVTALTMFLSASLLRREIERRTVFLVLSRPVSRTVFVLGRTLGVVLVAWALTAILSLVLVIELLVLKVEMRSALVIAIIGLAQQLVLVAAIGAMFSAVSGIITATVATVGLYIVGNWASDLDLLSRRVPSELLGAFIRGVGWLLPPFERLDFKWSAAYAKSLDPSVLVMPSLHAAAYTVLLMSIAVALFRRADFQ